MFIVNCNAFCVFLWSFRAQFLPVPLLDLIELQFFIVSLSSPFERPTSRFRQSGRRPLDKSAPICTKDMLGLPQAIQASPFPLKTLSRSPLDFSQFHPVVREPPIHLHIFFTALFSSIFFLFTYRARNTVPRVFPPTTSVLFPLRRVATAIPFYCLPDYHSSHPSFSVHARASFDPSCSSL